MSRLAKFTLIIAVFFALEKMLGFVRQILIARQFGLSRELDAFNAANNLPDLLFALISGGALAIALIPVLSEYLGSKGRPAAWDLFSRIANLVFLVTASLSLLIALFAGPIVRGSLGVAPGFTSEQQVMVINLMRLDLISTLVFSLSGLVIAGLQANQHFLLPAIAPSMYDLGMLFGVIILAPAHGYHLGPVTLPGMGLGIYGLAYGTILGAILFLAIQIPGLVRYQFRYTPAVNLRHPGVQKVLSLLGPRILTMLFIQLVFIIQDNIASRLPVGAVSALVYGWLFMQVPETLIGTAIGTALLPTLSEQAARGDWEGFRLALNRSARVILALTLPAAALIMVSIRSLVGILGFEGGALEMVVWTTRAFLLGLMGQALLEVSARGFYAQQNARLPLAASSLTTLTFTILSLSLSIPLGVAGIGLANALAFSGEALLLWFLLSRGHPGVLRLGHTLPRAVAAGLVGAGVVFGVMQLPLPMPGLLVGVAALGCGGLITLPFIWPEVRLLIHL